MNHISFIISLIVINNVLAQNDSMPDVPTYLIEHSELLPEQSSRIMNRIVFEKYIPIACFCDQLQCNAKVQYIESPVIGLLTLEGEIVKSLEVNVKHSELMYIALIDQQTNFGNGTYLTRYSYWQLTGGQHRLLAGVPLHLEIHRQVSITMVKDKKFQYYYGLDETQLLITALEMNAGLKIPLNGMFNSKTQYQFSPSSSDQVVGVYQLFHELNIHSNDLLSNYIENKKSGAVCFSYRIMKKPCGVLQLFPSLIQHTSTFRQVSVNLIKADSSIIVPTSRLTQRNKETRVFMIRLLVISILTLLITVFIIVSLIFIWRYFKASKQPQYLESIQFTAIDDQHDYEELNFSKSQQ